VTEYWATEDLPAYAWESDQPPPEGWLHADLWGQGLTSAAADTIRTVHVSEEYL
jgi:hypothetical protein